MIQKLQFQKYYGDLRLQAVTNHGRPCFGKAEEASVSTALDESMVPKFEADGAPRPIFRPGEWLTLKISFVIAKFLEI